MRVETDGGAPCTVTFANLSDLTNWSTPSLNAPSIENGELHIVASRSSHLLMNSKPLAITLAGPVRFSVRATIPTASAQSGAFTLMFLNDKKELGRASIPFDVPTITLPPALTDTRGRWRVPIPAGAYKAHCTYDGTPNLWPAEASAASE